MYYQNYEDYMRSVLGYDSQNTDLYRIDYQLDEPDSMRYQNNEEMDSMYPEVYRLIKPIVNDVCDKYTGPITNEALRDLVEEAYQRVTNDNDIAIKINITNRDTEKKVVQNRVNTSEPIRKSNETENRQYRPQNPFLRDLIQILILNRLFGGFFPNRPPRPRPPMRPPVRPPYMGGPF